MEINDNWETKDTNENDQDAQHLKGTLKVLELIHEAIGKPFSQFRFIPQPDSCGHVEYCSLLTLQKSQPLLNLNP